MRSPVPVARSPPSKGNDVVGYRSHNVRTTLHHDGAHQAVNRPQPQVRGKAPIFYSHPNSINTSGTPKADYSSECKNNSLVPVANQKGGTLGWDRRSRQTEQPVKPPPHHLQDNSTSNRSRPVVQESRVANLAPTRQRMRRPIVTTFPSAPTVKVSPKTDGHSKPSQPQPQHQVKPVSQKLKPPKASTLRFRQHRALTSTLACKQKPTEPSIPKNIEPEPIGSDVPRTTRFSQTKPTFPANPQPAANTSSVTKPTNVSSTSNKESRKGQALLKQKPSDDNQSANEAPKKIVPFQPNFGKKANDDKTEKEDDIDDSIFNCPTSPLIHMSESCVPLIQRALKSAAPTVAQGPVGRYSPDMIMSDDELKPMQSKDVSNGKWVSSLPSQPFRPSFAPTPKPKTGKLSMAKDGQRKAVRRPRRKSTQSQKKVEYLFPPTSPVPALQMRQPRPIQSVKTLPQTLPIQAPKTSNKTHSTRLKQPPKGARPLVLLDTISLSPEKGTLPQKGKEQGNDSTNKPKSQSPSYVHLSEQRELIDLKVNKGGSNIAKSKPTGGLNKAFKEPKRKTASVAVPEPESNSSAGSLENALKVLGEKDNISCEDVKEMKNKRQKRKLSDSSKQISEKERVGKRAKVTFETDKKEVQEINVNPDGLELFDSLQKSSTSAGDTAKTNGSTTNKQVKSSASLNLAETPEKQPPEKTITIPISYLEPAPRSNNGVVFLIDGVTAGSCISIFRKRKTIAECFVTKKIKQKKKNSSDSVTFHVNPSVGHQLTYFCARHVARWKLAPPGSVQDENARTQHKVFVVTKDPRFSMLIKSLKADGVDAALVKELPNVRTLLESLVK